MRGHRPEARLTLSRPCCAQLVTWADGSPCAAWYKSAAKAKRKYRSGQRQRQFGQKKKQRAARPEPHTAKPRVVTVQADEDERERHRGHFAVDRGLAAGSHSGDERRMFSFIHRDCLKAGTQREESDIAALTSHTTEFKIIDVGPEGVELQLEKPEQRRPKPGQRNARVGPRDDAKGGFLRRAKTRGA